MLALPLAACGPAGPSLPGAPEVLAARPLDGAVAVSWILGSDGGSALLNHAFSLDDGDTWTAFDPLVTSGDASIGELVNDALHRLGVRAVNGCGPGAASAAVDAVTVPTTFAFTPDGGAVIGGRTRATQPVSTLPATGNAGNEDGFVAALSADGATWRWVRALGGSSNDRVEGVAVADGTLVAIGSYFGTATFGPLGTRPPP